jgi:NAD(P)-dependent dehydrogenase (short-subunit alcohol dehydrogenase family)
MGEDDTMGTFDGKVALVTGAGGGIGRATALAFAAEGAHVMVADIDPAGGDETVRLIAEAGGAAAFQRSDVADQASAEAMVRATVERFGGLDCAVNNAGIDPEVTPVPDWDIAVLDRILSVNLRGLILCMKAEIDVMRARGGGAIVNFSSFAGVAGIPAKPFYCAAKHGVVGVTKSAGLDQAKHGIRINGIAPGYIDTPMALANTLTGGATLEMIRDRNPTRRVGTAEEVAAAVLYLCSPQAGFIIGQTLSIDGGISAA